MVLDLVCCEYANLCAYNSNHPHQCPQQRPSIPAKMPYPPTTQHKHHARGEVRSHMPLSNTDHRGASRTTAPARSPLPRSKVLASLQIMLHRWPAHQWWSWSPQWHVRHSVWAYLQVNVCGYSQGFPRSH